MAWLTSVLIVFAFAALGVLVTGDPTKGPYAALEKPSFTPTLQIWLGIAVIYYAGMILALGRLLKRRGRPGATIAIAAVCLVLLLNEVWNVFLFRLGRADLAFVTLVPFAALAVFSAWASLRVDRLSGALLSLYVTWLIFDLVWAHRLAALN